MNLDDAVLLETFPNRILAELAASLLEGEGIEALIMADDAGGAYPALQFVRGVRLLVAPEDETRAREFLKAMQEGVLEEAE
ncbi:MAG: DUF2007 domain-containing protein [Desulfobaccales bacterium]|nr:DUF2007 domain-containing protein [Desulfobaccales bacterium]